MGREGICRVEEKEGEGLFIAWIDNSPDALRRQEAIRKKERQDKGDEEREQKLIRDQIERAEMATANERQVDDSDAGELRREEGVPIKLSFGSKLKEQDETSPPAVFESHEMNGVGKERTGSVSPPKGILTPPPTDVSTPPPEKVSMKMGASNKPRNVFTGLSRKSAPSSKGAYKETPKKPRSEAERIMREEIERKRMRGGHGDPGFNVKRPRLL